MGKRAIPRDLEPVTAQALLNMFLATSDEELLAARKGAISCESMINRDFDAWLQERRNQEAIQRRAYNKNRQRNVPK